jgi:diguanylate cyclase (GGDEF)-like protein
MKRDKAKNVGEFNLFDNEERVIERALEMTAKLGEVSDGVKILVDAYSKGYREQRRLLRLSDRIQLDLQKANQNLAGQAHQLTELNSTLQAEIEQRKKLEAELRILVTTDVLTGVFTRRYLFEAGERELTRHYRRKSPLCAIILDIDHFKNVNDTFGHAAGDEALCRFSSVCREILRKIDIFGRLGGEEFAVIMPETDIARAVEVSERLRAAIANVVISCGKLSFRVTASIGVAEVTFPDDTLEMLLSRADKALYRAKNDGRNRILTYDKTKDDMSSHMS